MTLNPGEFYFWCKEYPMFTQWAQRKDALFPPKEAGEKKESFDLTSKIYVLMKRLGQDYSKIMEMPSEERDKLFEMEMQLIKKELASDKNEP
jgi:hypothetical protein